LTPRSKPTWRRNARGRSPRLPRWGARGRNDSGVNVVGVAGPRVWESRGGVRKQGKVPKGRLGDVIRSESMVHEHGARVRSEVTRCERIAKRPGRGNSTPARRHLMTKRANNNGGVYRARPPAPRHSWMPRSRGRTS
jgi:hypothetical protein